MAKSSKKSGSFWTPVKSKSKSHFTIKPTSPTSYIATQYSKKHISSRPVFGFNPTRKKDLTYPQAKALYPGLNPQGDADKDGVKNWLDCRPFDPKKQDEPRKPARKKREKVLDLKPGYEYYKPKSPKEKLKKKMALRKRNMDKPDFDYVSPSIQTFHRDRNAANIQEQIKTKWNPNNTYNYNNEEGELMYAVLPGAEKREKEIQKFAKKAELYNNLRKRNQRVISEFKDAPTFDETHALQDSKWGLRTEKIDIPSSEEDIAPGMKNYHAEERISRLFPGTTLVSSKRQRQLAKARNRLTRGQKEEIKQDLMNSMSSFRYIANKRNVHYGDVYDVFDSYLTEEDRDKYHKEGDEKLKQMEPTIKKFVAENKIQKQIKDKWNPDRINEIDKFVETNGLYKSEKTENRLYKEAASNYGIRPLDIYLGPTVVDKTLTKSGSAGILANAYVDSKGGLKGKASTGEPGKLTWQEKVENNFRGSGFDVSKINKAVEKADLKKIARKPKNAFEKKIVAEGHTLLPDDTNTWPRYLKEEYDKQMIDNFSKQGSNEELDAFVKGKKSHKKMLELLNKKIDEGPYGSDEELDAFERESAKNDIQEPTDDFLREEAKKHKDDYYGPSDEYDDLGEDYQESDSDII